MNNMHELSNAVESLGTVVSKHMQSVYLQVLKRRRNL